jgi:fibronectin-binding autotransporter adhesin
MALVGHISGSAQSQSVIGVTGSVVFANQPAVSFPSITSVGSDVVFFVSGAVGGKNVAGQKTVAVFGGDAVVSGSLTVGSGSVKITSNDIQFSGAGNRIELAGSDLKFFDASNPSGFTLTSLGSGGGGGGPSYWTSITNNEIFTTGSVVASGSIIVKDGTGGTRITLDAVAGDVTGSNFRSTGGTFSTSQTSFSLLPTTATSVNFAAAASTLNMGAPSTGRTTIRNDLALTTGNIIGTTAAAGPLTLISSGNIVAKLDIDGGAAGHRFEVQDSAGAAKFSTDENGDSFVARDLFVTGALAVNGTQVTTTNSTMTLFSGASTLNIGGTSTVLTLGSGTSSRVNIPGDLYVQGNVTALESTNTKVKDSLIILGSGSAGPSAASAIAFASGSVTTNQALVFGAGVGQDILAAVKADVSDGSLAISAGTYSTYVPIRASKFELAGTTAFVTSSDGTTLTASGNAANLIATTGVATVRGSTDVILNAQSNNISLQNNGSPVLRVSGSGASGATLEFKGGALTTTANLFSDVGTTVATINLGTQASTLSFGNTGGSSTFNGNVTGSNFAVNGGSLTTSQTSFNLVNTTATTVNFAGAATAVTIGGPGVGSSTNVVNVLTASDGIVVGAGGGSFANIIAGVGKTTANLFNTVATTVNFAGAGTNISVGAAGSGATYLKNASLFVSGATTFGASVLPSADVTWDLGSPTFRWANMYTGDLHLKNDRGDWTIIEEPDFLTITNNRNGKRYKFVMEEIG